ncbi:ATP-binding cassette domain-containing protein [Modestobacter sp. I12A-02662]|uniref:ATP-binding cassette domain-containing protein n=1 Tax=Modestobacter sp. I12A-02662 TaxID=1730496 RepID=UPI0034DEC183
MLLQFAALGELFAGAVLAEQVFAALDPELVAPSWLDRRPHELSGGQLQRVALARGLLARPRFLVADEITSGLDAVTQVRVWHLLLERCRSAGIGVLAISHDRPLLEAVADRVVDWPPPSEDTEPGLRRPLEVAQAGKAAR